MAHQEDYSYERQLYAIAGELERLVWRLMLRPAASQHFAPDRFRVLQLATVVELPPNVYIQSIRIASHKPLDRYVHVWCLAPTPEAEDDENEEEGAWEERTLLRFHTPAFPDPQFTQRRPGMDLNLGWWQTIRERLQALTSEMESAESGASADKATTTQSHWQGVGDTSPHPPIPPDQSQAAAGRAGRRLQHAPSALSPTEQLLADYLLLREQVFEQRDAVYRRLEETYFACYPDARTAAQRASEEEIAEMIRTWISQGCPVAPAASSEAQVAQAQPQTQHTPWPLAMELERLQTAAQEHSRILERLCEAQPDGHHIEVARAASGASRTVCSRCGASLSRRTPDAREGWLLH